jgi:hypothetical protein
MLERGLDRFGRGGRANRFDEAANILLDPIIGGVDERSETVAQRIADRFWNAFQYKRCLFFDAEGRFVIPDR